MNLAGEFHPNSSLYNRPLAIFPCARMDYYLKLNNLGDLAQGGSSTVKATRRVIEMTGVGTDGHVVRVYDGVTNIDFELDDDGSIAGSSEELVPIGATAEETAYNLAQQIAYSVSINVGTRLRATIKVEHFGRRVILRNYDASPMTSDLEVSSAAASFSLESYLLYNPEDFKEAFSSVPNYQTPSVWLRGPFDEKDTTLSQARVVMHGLDIFDNPVASEVTAKTNSHSGSLFYFPDVFSRVDQIRIYDFSGDVEDEIAVGYGVPRNMPYLNPESSYLGLELALYSAGQGACNPFIQGLYTIPAYTYMDTQRHRANDAAYIEIDSTDTNTNNITAGDHLYIADEFGGTLFTFSAAPAADTDILREATATAQADTIVAAINAYYADGSITAKRLNNVNFPDAAGFVFFFGSEKLVSELTEGDPPTLIANTDFGPDRYVDLDASGFQSVIGITDESMRDGDLLILSSTQGEDIYEFDDDAQVVAGHETVTIGATGAATLANLVTAINTTPTIVPNTDFKAISASATTFRCQLVRDDRGGDGITLSTQSANLQQSLAKIRILRRVPTLRTSLLGIYPQAAGHYNEATGAPYNAAVFAAYAWDTMDMSFDPYGLPYRGIMGAPSAGGPRMAIMDPDLATSTTLNVFMSVFTGALAGAYMVMCNDPHERASRGYIMHPSYRDRRAGELQVEDKSNSGRFKTSGTSAPPYVSMPTGQKGGRR